MQALETKLERLSPARRDRFIEIYLDGLVKWAAEYSSDNLMELVNQFKRQPTEKDAKFTQETLTIIYAIIGDGSGEDFGTRYKRAVRRRVKVGNIIRAIQGLESLEMPVTSEEMNYEDVIMYHRNKINFWEQMRAEAMKTVEPEAPAIETAEIPEKQPGGEEEPV